jgi:hypothetical protein
MSTAQTTVDQPPLDAKAVARDDARELLGQVRGTPPTGLRGREWED